MFLTMLAVVLMELLMSARAQAVLFLRLRRILERCALRELWLSLLLSALDAVYSFRTCVWLRVRVLLRSVPVLRLLQA